jgi:hypothetical protein
MFACKTNEFGNVAEILQHYGIREAVCAFFASY